MFLTKEEESILNGEKGNAERKSMEILVALGKIYGAEKLIPVGSVQVAGVSYHNLGDAGLEYLSELSKDGKVKVLTTLNPAGMDMNNWKSLGIPEDFAKKQIMVIDAFEKMGILTNCTCTPYLIGNLPRFGEHIAWAESSAVAFANGVIGARTNREGGPSALAAAIIGKTPAYGLHLDKNRLPTITVKVETAIKTMPDFGALGYVIGKKAQRQIPYILGIKEASIDLLKTFGASAVTYGMKPMYYMEGITPEKADAPIETLTITSEDIKSAFNEINDDTDEIDFVFLGCPHASIKEIAEIAKQIEGRKVKSETWIGLSRTVKQLSDERGYTKIIEDSGIKFACDTCVAVAPLKGRFKSVATTSAKACFYSRGHNAMKTKIGTINQCIDAAVSGKWN